MTADSRAETVRRYYELIDEEAYEEIFEMFAADIVYHRPGQPTLEGIEEFEEFYLNHRPVEEGTHDLQQLVAEGDHMASRGRFQGVISGEEGEHGFAEFFRFDDDDRIVERWSYSDRDEL